MSNVQRLREAKAAFNALPDIVREAMNDATEVTLERIRASAVQRVPVRYGFLRDRIKWKLNRKIGFGRVGISNEQATTPDGKTVYPSLYGKFAEFGTIHQHAHPFMAPAAEAEVNPHIQRCRDARSLIEKEAAAIGNRFA